MRTAEPTLNAAGISSGAPNEVQVLTLSSINNPALIRSNRELFHTPRCGDSEFFAPIPNASGVTTMATIKLNDGGSSNTVVSPSFTVTVRAVTMRRISPIADQVISEDVASAIPFTV